MEHVPLRLWMPSRPALGVSCDMIRFSRNDVDGSALKAAHEAKETGGQGGDDTHERNLAGYFDWHGGSLWRDAVVRRNLEDEESTKKWVEFFAERASQESAP